MIGSLIHLANHTRPDISLVVGLLSEFKSKPNQFLMQQGQRIFGYLRRTAEYRLTFMKSSSYEMLFHCDSDYAGNLIERKSRTGWVGFFKNCAWASRKTQCLSLSTAEAEFVALSE